MKRLRRRSAAPLENAHRQAVFRRRQGEPQGGRRWRGGCCGRPPQTGKNRPPFRRHLQTAQNPGIDAGVRPGQHAGKTAAGQQLFNRPGRLLARRQNHQPFERYPGRRPGRSMRQPGRRDQGQPATGGRQTSQCRQQQAHFAKTAAVDEDFGQVSPRPAATRQLGIEFGVAARNRVFRQAGQRIAAPDITSGQHVSQSGRQRHGAHDKVLIAPRIRPTAMPSMAKSTSSGWTMIGWKSGFSAIR